MNDLGDTWHTMPLTAMIPVALIVITGLVLWSAGRSVLRAAFAIVGLMVGAALGWIVGESFGGQLTPWIGALVGAVLLAVGGALMYRAAVAVSMSVLIAVASPMAVITMAELQALRAGRTLGDGEVSNPLAERLSLVFGGGEATTKPSTEEFDAAVQREAMRRASDALQERIDGSPQLKQFQRYGQRLFDVIKQKWEQTPKKMRATLVLTAVCGAVVGLLLGILAASFSASAITSFGGSLLWLSGLHILALRFGVPDGPWFPKSGTTLLLMWLITTLAGVVIQWTVQRKRADKTQRQKKTGAENDS